MKDIELRGAILEKLYQKRKDPSFRAVASTMLIPGLTDEEFSRICEHLREYKLIDVLEWHEVDNTTYMQFVKISARGIDVIESEIPPDIGIEIMRNQNINISGSQNVVIGNNNSQEIKNHIIELAQAIQASDASERDKEEAKGLLSRFIEHPLVTSIIGSAVGLIK